VTLGGSAIDGTKVKANASKHKAMSYGRMGETETRLKTEIAELLRQAEAQDAAAMASTGRRSVATSYPPSSARRRAAACR